MVSSLRMINWSTMVIFLMIRYMDMVLSIWMGYPMRVSSIINANTAYSDLKDRKCSISMIR